MSLNSFAQMLFDAAQRSTRCPLADRGKEVVSDRNQHQGLEEPPANAVYYRENWRSGERSEDSSQNNGDEQEPYPPPIDAAIPHLVPNAVLVVSQALFDA